jgi:alanyl-tRNA synthetase
MLEQRERARAASKFGLLDTAAYQELVEAGMTSRFTGYEAESGKSTVAALLVDGQRVPRAAAGQRVEVVVGETPFYAESGGQAGDVGTLTLPSGAQIAITDTHKPFGDLIVHFGVLDGGAVSEGDAVTLQVDHDARQATRRNHSATHLLHHALREVLGDHVRQRGSLVGPERLRFDFSHTSGVTDEELRRIERRVNAMVLANEPVVTEVLSMDAALAAGAIAFFEEKYGADVRMLRVGSESIELCGGTHARATGDIGLFKIVSEGAISSGVRRVEAVTGMNTVRYVQRAAGVIRQIADQLRVGPEQLIERVDKLLAERKALTVERDQARVAARVADASAALSKARDIGGLKVAGLRLDGVGGKDLRALAERLRDQLGGPGVVLVTGADGDKVSLVVAATKDAAQRVHAGQLVGALAALVGGRGGGKPELAQAGGTDASQLDRLVRDFYAQVTAAVGG